MKNILTALGIGLFIGIVFTWLITSVCWQAAVVEHNAAHYEINKWGDTTLVWNTNNAPH